MSTRCKPITQNLWGLKKLSLHVVVLLVVACLVVPSMAVAQSSKAVVEAVLFYSPNCGHCHMVINEVLMPMVDEYGDQLQIMGIDTSQPGGSQLYQAAIEHYQVPPQRRGVPTLIIGDVVLVGSGEIPEQFPTLVEQGLAAGGIGPPDIPGLAQMLAQAQDEPAPTSAPPETATPAPTLTAISLPAVTPVSTLTAVPLPTATPAATLTAVPLPTATPAPSPTDVSAPSMLTVGKDEIVLTEDQDPPSDPAGSALAGVVLAGLVLACMYAARRMALARQSLLRLCSRDSVAYAKTWAIPLLTVLGLIVAAYLAYVETNHVEAVCGPVGKCNIVQTSAYAKILGIPVAVLGVLNYLAIGVLWAGQRHQARWLANLSALGLLGLTLFGVLFSIYLTCLELFVIHAICAWCLGSAVITMLVMFLVVGSITEEK